MSHLAALLVAPFLVGDNPQTAFARERVNVVFFCFIMRLVFIVPLIRKALNIELLFLTIVLKVVVVRIQSYAGRLKKQRSKNSKRPRLDVAE